MRSVFICDSKRTVGHIYDGTSLNGIRKYTDIDQRVYTSAYLRTHRNEFSDAVFVFTCWGMPSLSTGEIREILPSLKAVFYGGGNPDYFSEAFLECGIKVFCVRGEKDSTLFGKRIEEQFIKYISEMAGEEK